MGVFLTKLSHCKCHLKCDIRNIYISNLRYFYVRYLISSTETNLHIKKHKHLKYYHVKMLPQTGSYIIKTTQTISIRYPLISNIVTSFYLMLRVTYNFFEQLK